MMRMMQGVTVIDFSAANNLLVTGSRDCVIRGWNPCSETPVMVLRGHEAPVIFLCVNELKVRLLQTGMFCLLVSVGSCTFVPV